MSIPPSDGSQLTESDLAPHMMRELERGYRNRERAQMSRADFAAGFIVACLALKSTSSFRPGALERASNARPTPAPPDRRRAH